MKTWNSKVFGPAGRSGVTRVLVSCDGAMLVSIPVTPPSFPPFLAPSLKPHWTLLSLQRREDFSLSLSSQKSPFFLSCREDSTLSWNYSAVQPSFICSSSLTSHSQQVFSTHSKMCVCDGLPSRWFHVTPWPRCSVTSCCPCTICCSRTQRRAAPGNTIVLILCCCWEPALCVPFSLGYLCSSCSLSSWS